MKPAELKLVGIEAIARFVLDDQGAPRYKQGARHRHYLIELRLRGDLKGVMSVVYMLDRTTYRDPIRETHDRTSGFSKQITSYGDYFVGIRVETTVRELAVEEWLSDLLRKGHEDDAAEGPVGDALEMLASL